MSKRSRRVARAMQADHFVAAAVYGAADRVVTNRNNWNVRTRVAHCLNLAADFRRRGLLDKARRHLEFIKGYRA